MKSRRRRRLRRRLTAAAWAACTEASSLPDSMPPPVAGKKAGGGFLFPGARGTLAQRKPFGTVARPQRRTGALARKWRERLRDSVGHGAAGEPREAVRNLNIL